MSQTLAVTGTLEGRKHTTPPESRPPSSIHLDHQMPDFNQRSEDDEWIRSDDPCSPLPLCKVSRIKWHFAAVEFRTADQTVTTCLYGSPSPV